MKPYPYNITNTAAQKNFNYHLSKCRRVVENAFGHQKARFRRIGKGIDNQIDNTNAVIMSCCVLYNFLRSEKDVLPQNWLLQQNRCPENAASLFQQCTDRQARGGIN